eukprot:4778163-Amphidinium_carterae.1
MAPSLASTQGRHASTTPEAVLLAVGTVSSVVVGRRRHKHDKSPTESGLGLQVPRSTVVQSGN